MAVSHVAVSHGGLRAGIAALAFLAGALPAVPALADAGDPPPAVVTMRDQLLNPAVNSFLFRQLRDVFEYRDVQHGPDVAPLPQGAAMAMPAITFAGQQRSYDQFAEDTFTNALLVLKDGKVVFENYRNRMAPDTRHIAFSMSKTLTALLIGIAVDKGEIASIDDRADKYVPQLKGSGYDGVTIRQIMQMRSGVDYQERYDFGEHPSFAAKLHQQAIVLNRMRFASGALETKRGNQPGSTFNYSTLDTMVLGWVLEQATGQKLEAQMQDRIWQPMGAEADGFWLADGPQSAGGRALNGMGFNATLRDFGRIGQLLLEGGKARGRQIVPARWIAQMTAMVPNGIDRMPGYGFQTWQIDKEPGAFSAVGLAGQFIYVHPQSHTVIVKLSYYPPVEPETALPETLEMFHAIVKAH
ncbi:MAG: hypothetical protein RLZZ08_1795 [Pseudomonadota bacterium]|jgi:CubicO group peptidase (beta-lactamase class C family)